MAAPCRGAQRMPHQRRADAAAALRRIDGERAEQQRRAGRARRDLPEPDGADDAAVLDRDEGQPARRLAAGAQAFGGLREADRAIGGVEQRLAGAASDGFSWRMVTMAPPVSCPCLAAGSGRSRAGSPLLGTATRPTERQMWMVFSGAKPLKATEA